MLLDYMKEGKKMNRRLGSFVTALVAAVTMCSILSSTPVSAHTYVPKHMTQEQLDKESGGHAESVEIYSAYGDSDGHITKEGSQELVKNNYLTGKLDDESESQIIEDFEDQGLTEQDYYTLKAQRAAKTTTNTTAVTPDTPDHRGDAPTVRYGWAQNGLQYWYYSDNGTSWVKSDWRQLDGKWYHFNESGVANRGWLQLGTKWYYFYQDCSMASNTIVGGYTITASGERLPK